MANKRNKKKLTSKQANRISLLISIAYFIFSFVNGMSSKLTGDDLINYWLISCITGTFFIYLVFYFFIFKGEEKKSEERKEKLEIVTIQYLSYTDFKQVYFLAKENEDNDNIAMMVEILQKEGCKFYAKLTENKNIHLIVKDKHNEEVYSTEIENVIYFNSNFKFEE